MSVSEFEGELATAYASSALTAYTFVKGATTANTTEKIDVCGAGEAAIGIACDGYGAADDAAYCVGGKGLLKVDGSGSAITAGARLKSAASGIGVLAGGSDAAYARAIGVSSAANDVIAVIYGDC